MTIRNLLIEVAIAASLVACSQSDGSPATPAGRLQADITAMKQFPTGKVSAACADALKELGSTMSDIETIQDSGKRVDPVSSDVLEGDQVEAEKACHSDTLRLCQDPGSPAAAQACAHIAQ